MTTLTMLRLNPGSRAARRSLHDPQAIHRTLMACFPETESKNPRRELGVLWRIEPGDAPTLLLQSNACPDITKLPTGYGDAQAKLMDEHMGALENGKIVHYRAALNPIRQNRTGGVNRQRVVPMAERLAWAADRVVAAGLNSLSEPTITGMPSNYITRGDRTFPIYTVRVDGVAQISDAAVLTAALRAGIGHAKAWGCGLMTVLPA